MTVGQVFDDPVRGISIQNVGAERRRCHAGHHDAGRHDAAQPSGQADGGRQRHERRAAMDARRQTISRSLPTPSPATAPCSDRRRTTSFADSGLTPGATVNYAVTATDAAGNVGLAATMAVTLPDTVGAERARERHGDREPGRPRARRLGGRDRQRRRRRPTASCATAPGSPSPPARRTSTPHRGRAAARPSPTPSSRSTRSATRARPARPHRCEQRCCDSWARRTSR